MPYCTQCGAPVGAPDRFCGKCGAQQAAAAAGATASGGAARATGEYFSDIKPRTAALLCYIPWFGWLVAILVMASQRFKNDTPENNDTRFHAFQGLYLFVAWLIADWVLDPALRLSVDGARVFHMGSPIAGVVKLAVMAGWVIMLIKTSRNERFRLPLIGELAERSVNEQRG